MQVPQICLDHIWRAWSRQNDRCIVLSISRFADTIMQSLQQAQLSFAASSPPLEVILSSSAFLTPSLFMSLYIEQGTHCFSKVICTTRREILGHFVQLEQAQATSLVSNGSTLIHTGLQQCEHCSLFSFNLSSTDQMSLCRSSVWLWSGSGRWEIPSGSSPLNSAFHNVSQFARRICKGYFTLGDTDLPAWFYSWVHTWQSTKHLNIGMIETGHCLKWSLRVYATCLPILLPSMEPKLH